MIAIKNILVATDFSEPASAAYLYGKNLARMYGAKLHVLHAVSDLNHFVIPPGTVIDMDVLQREMEEEAMKRLAELTQADQASLKIRTVVPVSSSIARTIVGYARDERVDLIVIGTQGRTGLAHLVLGSVAQHVVQSAPCPVLTVHHPEHEFVHPDALVVTSSRQPLSPSSRSNSAQSG